MTTETLAYLAGPMRLRPLFNFPAFFAAEEYLTEKFGFRVLNPARHDTEGGFDPSKDLDEQDFDLHAAFRWDVLGVLQSDMVVVLPDWQRSEGARLEVALAKAIGIPVRNYPDLSLVDEALDETVLQEAQRIVYGKRQQDYGHPRTDFTRTAKIWGAILGADVTPEEVALCMVGLKVSRLVNTPHHHDSIVDIAGYAGTYELLGEPA